jgi:hypothetical protein
MLDPAVFRARLYFQNPIAWNPGRAAGPQQMIRLFPFDDVSQDDIG